MTHLRLTFVRSSLLALSLVGCGGSVETAVSGGVGGAGSSTSSSSSSGVGGAGAGGAGAGGGMEGTCPPEVKAGAYNQPPVIGLSAPPPSPTGATVVSVADASLEYSLVPGGPLDVFMWRGPSLVTVFKAGDAVTVGVVEGWHYVAGQMIAAARREYQFVPPDALPAVPMSKAPLLGYAEQCSFPESSGDCGQPPANVRVLAVRAGSGPDAVDIPVGATKVVGAFTIHNATSVALPGYGGSDCVLEALFMSGVTALGPIGK